MEQIGKAYQQYLKVYQQLRNEYPKPNDHIPQAPTINEMKQTIIMIYFIKEKTPLQERLEEYLEQERKNYPELNQYIKNKEWNNQQYLNTKEDYIEITNEKVYNKWIKEEKEKERNEETREILQDNEFINAWEIIKEANKSEPWTNFDTYKEYITQTEEQLAAQILKAREYFAKELIRMIHDNFELSDLKTRIKLAKNECLQHYLSTLKIKRSRKIEQPPTKEKIINGKMYHNNTFNIKREPLEDKLFQITPTTSRIFGRKNIQWKDTIIENEISISERVEKYKELREKMNNIFEKSSEKGPLFNHLTLMEHLEESLYIRIAAYKKNQLTKGQYQDWQQQMFQKIEKQYNNLHNEGRQFSLKNIMQNQIKKGYDNLHEMLNHD
ncbi:4763_t:CDS:2 [Gigaspora margarita]|uniref:4763_t:CDS:1 n=1 Tax=Gigaspora margarita TaxID=4874 RepID=A0ABN7X3W6_GIGMA|nr:4763_t:CDS:2 [Gigaspora margarita]